MMPTHTIIYRTFPMYNNSGNGDTNLASPTSVVAAESIHHVVLEPLSLSSDTRPAKVAKIEGEWKCPVSAKASRTSSSVPGIIKPIVESIKLGCQREDRKEPISLATADAAVSHIPPCTKAMEAVVQTALYKPHAAGYTHACGTPEARRAIATHHSCREHTLSPDHVIVTNGCSGALDLALTSLLDPGTILLVPNPGFPLYQEIAESIGASVVPYRLDPNSRWQCDMDHLEEIMANHSQVRAIVINNPSSPTGSVFSEKHLQQILDFALRHQLPIVADEVYGDLTFGSNKFHPMAEIAAKNGQRVPVITSSGLSKQFMIPGWRVGWLTFHDNVQGSLKNVEEGARRLAQVIHGVSHLTQSAIPILLTPSTPGLMKWKETYRSTLEHQAMLLCSSLNDNYCLKVAPPQGSMYTIVKINVDRLDIADDMEFAMKLVQEENVFILPGSSFGVPNSFRVAYTAQDSTLEIASKRINDFCRRHTKQ